MVKLRPRGGRAPQRLDQDPAAPADDAAVYHPGRHRALADTHGVSFQLPTTAFAYNRHAPFCFTVAGSGVLNG